MNHVTYTVTATDACGDTYTQLLTTGSGTPTPLSVSGVVGAPICSSIEGRTTMIVTITGAMANFAYATVKVVAGPNLIGEVGDKFGAGQWAWKNAVPGATYTLEVDNGCGQTEQVQVTVPLSAQVVDLGTTVTVEQLCGGTGNIFIETANNTYNQVTFSIKNSANVTIATGGEPGATLSNLAAGTYKVITYITGCATKVDSIEVQILPIGQAPVITKKIGVICEDANGNLTSTGSALLSFFGANPLKFEYRLTSGSDADYVTLTNDSDGSETITGLIPGTSYTIRVTDNCGNSTVTQIAIGQLSPVRTETALQPCVGKPYVLSVPDMVDATYTWTRNGVTVSNERSLSFNPYVLSDNGSYVCTINILDGCVTRVATVNLNSVNCDLPLPVNLISFTASIEEKRASLNWKVTNEKDFSHFEIERSSSANSFHAIGYIKGNSVGKYTFVDKEKLSGLQYYRLKMVDIDGSYAYSRVRNLNFDENGVGIFPNPASDYVMLDADLYKTIKSVEIINSSGRSVYKGTKVSSDGINVSHFSEGLYLINVSKKDGSKYVQKIMIAR